MNPNPPSKIMLVEDDPTMRSLLKTLLEIEGFQVELFSEVNEDNIIPVVREKSPDVLLLDVHLRNTNGLNVLKRLRQEKETASLPVLMTSGTDVRDKCMSLGASGFLLKPYMPDDLINWIRQRSEKTN